MCVCVCAHAHTYMCMFGGFFWFFLEKLCHQNKLKKRTIEKNLMHLKVLLGLFEEVYIVEVVIAILKYFYQN